MPRDPRIIELLLRYEEALEQGRPVTAEELCREAPELLDELHRAVAAQTDKRRPDLPATDEEPCTVPSEMPTRIDLPAREGRYEVEGEIARGGMGAVWRARDPELNRALAIKVLRADCRSRPGLKRRFLEEAQITGQLQHPGIPPVHEVGTLPDGRPFFAMKLIRGRTLAELLKKRAGRADDLPHFLGIFEQVCQAVAYAHSRGVIHRDLKPANVMVGSFGEVQVMDWGLAKVLGQTDGEQPPAAFAASAVKTVRSGSPGADSRPGTVLGTPAYVSPEQALGEVDRLDRRSDVFGLGAILCEVLTGLPPYVAPDGDAAWRKAVRAELADAFARLDGCGADGELVGLARRCLAAESNHRPASAAVVADTLAAYQAAVQERLRQVELERAAAQVRVVEQRKRRRVALALAAAVLALVAVGAGGGLWAQRQAAERRADQARHDTEQRQLVESALEKAAALREQQRFREAKDMLEQGRNALGASGPGDLHERLHMAETDLRLVTRLDAIRQRRVAVVEGKFDTRTAARDYAAAFKEAGLGEVGDDEEAVAARVRASGVSGPLVAALDDWASVTREATQSSWLLGVARRAAPDPWGDRFRDPRTWRDRQALEALADETLRHDAAGVGELSPQLLESLHLRLWAIGADPVPLLRAAQRRHPNDFWLNTHLGAVLGDAEQALACLGAAVALRPDAAVAHYNLGTALVRKSDLEGAIAEYRLAIDIDCRFAAAHANLGASLLKKRDLEGSIAASRRAIELDPNNARAHTNVGNVLRARKNPDGAIAEYRQAIELDPNLASAHSSLGNALRDKGELDAAIAEYKKAIDLDPKDPLDHANLANVLYDKKDVAGAVAEYRTAIALDPRYAPAYNDLGKALRASGDVAGAVVEYHKATVADPQYDKPHYNLGNVLRDNKKDLAGAVAEYHRAIELNPKYGLARVALAGVLLQQGRFAEAARSYADGFADAPELADDPTRPHRYNAACCATRAAGHSEGAKHLPDKVPLMLRQQALRWLRSDLAVYVKLAERDDARPLVRKQLSYWQQDADLASVRDPQALAQLPEDEGREWCRLWDDVAALLKKVADKP